MSSDLKNGGQAEHAAKKANSMLGMLKRTFRFRGVDMWRRLYTTYIRPHLEFAASAWSPYLKKDIYTTLLLLLKREQIVQ